MPNGTTLNWTNMTPAARAGQLGTLSADNPSWTDRLAGMFSNAMGYVGATPQGQRNAYNVAQKASGLIPGVGQALSANEAYRGYQEGNYPKAILGALGAVPIPGAGRGALSEAEDVARSSKGVVAYHGSTDPSITKFDYGKTGGTGEMTQGNGIYFTDHPDVARNYMFNDPKGKVYQVQLNHDPNKFMEWDTPFEDQTPQVKGSLRKLGVTEGESGYDIHQGMVDQLMETGKHDDEFSAADQVAQNLRKSGIPGIRYQDYETEVPGDHTNHVIFGGGENQIQILGNDADAQ